MSACSRNNAPSTYPVSIRTYFARGHTLCDVLGILARAVLEVALHCVAVARETIRAILFMETSERTKYSFECMG